MRAIGRRFQKGVSGNPNGRPRGAKDRLPRGSVRAAYHAFIATGGGVKKMTEVINKAISGYLKPKAGLEKGRLAISVMELGAKVMDRIDQQQEGLGAGVTIIVKGIDPMKLGPGGPGAPQALARSNKAGRSPRRQR